MNFSKATSSSVRFPFTFLAGAFSLILLILISVSMNIHHAYLFSKNYYAIETRLRQLWTDILSLDIELGMLVQLTAATQNSTWETRYHLLKPTLDSAIREAIQLVPETKLALKTVDDAHLKTIDMENFVFSLISNRETREANLILSSKEYQHEKQRYSYGLAQVSHLLKQKAQGVQSETQKKVLNSVLFSIFSIVCLFVILIVILMRWRKAVVSANQMLQGKETKLVEINQTLEAEISERQQLQEQLQELAIHDPLTGLYNRRYFNQRCAEEMTRYKRTGRPFAILLCDLDHFKLVNDAFGHPVGDEILKLVAKQLKEALREVDLVFRWGGDEFILILPDVSQSGVLSIIERIRRKVRSVNEYASVTIDCSIGAAFYPTHASNIEALVQIADRALYFSKETQSHFHIGDEEYKLETRSIKMVFQPIWDIRTNQILGYEALSRDPKEELSILELFKQYNAIGQLRDLKLFCFKQQLKIAKEQGVKKLFLNVDFDMLFHLEPIPKPAEMDVILEFSEAEALYKPEQNLAIAKEWREKGGYHFAIDDFGSGFISFSFMLNLIPEYIKIDRSVIVQAAVSLKFKKFLKNLADTLRYYVREDIIAEGVETSEELETVKSAGILFAQGFLLGKPQELHL